MSRLLSWLYWLCRPGIYLLLHRSRRTRVLLWYKNEILLVRSDFGERKWGLPGGGVKRGEPEATAAAREVQEEVGVQIDPQKLRFLSEKKSGWGQFNWPYVTLVFYEYRLGKRPRDLYLQRFEISEATWASQHTLSKIYDQGLDQNLKELLGSLL